MLIEQLLGKTITNIYVLSGIEQGWLDTASCFVEIDNDLIIKIPNGFQQDVSITKLNKDAASIFIDLSDIPVYIINYEKKEVKYELEEYRENKVKYLQNRKIKDFLFFDEEWETGYLELDNGYIISETTMSSSGTGLAGLNYYESFAELIKTKGNNYTRLSMT